MKPTFAEILKAHPDAFYILRFKRATLYYASAKYVEMDILKDWLKYCPNYTVRTSRRGDVVTATFYRKRR